MPNSDREVSLKISTSTSGEESLRAVSEDLKRLSIEGGAAAPRFEELANKLDDLANQQALIDSFAKLKQRTVENEEALRGATTATAEAVRALRDRQAALGSSAAAESAANQRLTEAKARLDDNKTALDAARKELTEYQAANKLAGGSIDGLASAIAFAKDSVRQYRDAVRESKSEVTAMSSEQRAASSAARDAAADVRTAARSFDEARLSAGEAKSAYDDSSVSLQRLRTELTQAGIQTSALSAHDAQLRTQMQQLSAEAIQLKQKMQSGTEESDRLSKSLSDAFAATGVRSASMLNAEITRIDHALIRLANDTKVSAAEFDRAWASGQSKITALRTEMSAASAGTNTLAVSAKEATSQITAMAAPLAALFAAQKFFEVNAQFDSTNRALVQMTGSAALAAKEIEYLKTVSNKLGLDVSEATKAYLSLTAATKGTSLEGAKTKEIFEAVAGAMGVLGKGSDETGRALAAVSQMASKGCHAAGTAIRMADGSEKHVETIRVGEQLMGSDGLARVVLRLAHGRDEMLRITPTNGYSFVVNLHHKLRVSDGIQAQTIDVVDYLALPRGRRDSLGLVHTSRGIVSFSVESVGPGEFFGFLISGDHLYLDAQGFEHHNTVAMEELRGQLGEALPGALQAAAKGLGITTQELITMVSSGSVLAEDLLPALATGLKQMYGTDKGIDGLASSWARLKNSINETFLFVGNSGAVTALVFILGQLAATVRGLTGAVDLLGKIIGITLAAIAQFDWTHPIDSITSWKNAVKEAADDIQQALDATTASSEKTSAAHDQTAASATKSGEAAAGAAPGFLAIQAAQAKANAETAKAIEQATKDLAAKRAQADAINALSQAFGTEIEKMQTEAATAREVSDAMQRKADASRIDADLRAKAVVQLQLEIDKTRDHSQAKKDSLDAAKKLAEGTEAEALKDQAAADAARVHAEALATKLKAYGDNSAEIAKYKDAMEKAKDEEGVVIARDAAHSASKKEVAAAHEKAAQAVALYRDALSDAISKIDLSAAADRRKASLVQAALNVERERLITMRDVANASGDSVEAARLDQRIREIDIKMLKAQAAASRAAADSILIKVKAMTAELEASDMLTDAKKAELAQLVSEAEAKKLDAEKSDILAERIRAVAFATDELRSRGSGSADGLTESLSSAANESDRLNESLRNRPGGTTPGGTAPGGTAPGTVKKDVSYGNIDWTKQAISMGLTGDTAKKFAEIAGDYFQKQVQEKLDSYGGNVISSTRYANDFGAAIELAKQQAYTSVKPTTMSAPAASKTVRLELNINGKQIDVDTSESAAEKLVAELQAAAART